MKFTWGHGIFLTLAAFIGFIAYLVVGTFQERVDLTSENYYEREVAFEDERHELMAGDKLGEVSVNAVDGELQLQLPADNWGDVEVNFYRAENADLDFSSDFPSANNGLLTLEKPVAGMWKIEIIASKGEETYRWKFSQYI